MTKSVYHYNYKVPFTNLIYLKYYHKLIKVPSLKKEIKPNSK